MRTTNDSIDLYTLLKRDEQLLQRQTLLPPLSNAIPFKSDTSKFLIPTVGKVFYTDGYSSFKQDDRYERTLYDEEMEVPSIGTDKQNFDMAEMITFDIIGASTRLPLMCKMIIYQQGATHEREPPILVRDACIQWDGIDRPRRNSADCLTLNKNSLIADNRLQRTKSSDYLFDGSTKSIAGNFLNDINRCSSVTSFITEDDDASSIITVGGSIRHRVSRLLHHHKYLRQIDTHILGRDEFYSVPFYQYRGRRYGQKNVELQMNESDLENTFNHTYHFDPPSYSVTVIIPARDHNDKLNSSLSNFKTFQSNNNNNNCNHTTIGFITPRQFVTIKRTFHGQVIDV